MFLIDDKLYKKAILKEESGDIVNLNTKIPNSIYLNPVQNSHQPLSSDKESMDKTFEKDHTKSIDMLEKEQTNEGGTIGKEQQLPIPEVPTSGGLVTPYKIIENASDMSTDQNDAKDDDCECYEQPPVLSASAERGRKRKKSGGLRDNFDSPPRKKEKKKSQTIKRKVSKRKTVGKPNRKKTQEAERDDDFSDDSDWEELRERYRRLRGDYDSPPRKREYRKSKVEKRYVNDLPVVGKNKTLQAEQNNQTTKEIRMVGARKRKSVQDPGVVKNPRREFVCKLCQSYYKTKSSLQRHNANVHSDQRGSKRTKSGDGERYIKRQKNNNNIAVSYLNYF